MWRTTASGTKTTAKPGRAHAQRPVHVLDVGEQPLVEQADPLDRRARDRHRGAVGAADVAQLVEAVGPAVARHGGPSSRATRGRTRPRTSPSRRPRTAPCTRAGPRPAAPPPPARAPRRAPARRPRRCSRAAPSRRRARAPAGSRRCSRRRSRGSRRSGSARPPGSRARPPRRSRRVEPLSTQIVSIPASEASARGVSSPPFQLRTTATSLIAAPARRPRRRAGPAGRHEQEHDRVEREPDDRGRHRAEHGARGERTRPPPARRTRAAATTTPRSVRAERAERPEQRREHERRS